MRRSDPTLHSGGILRLLSLSRCVALALSTAPLMAIATQTVTNCNDSGSGSLRSAITAATEGDTVDMSKLPCSKITLSSAALKTSRNNLTIIGKGQDTLTIDGGSHSFGVIQHTGTGTLTISDLTIAHASYPQGGCISTLGSANLARVTMTECTATGAGNESLGGAIGAVKNVVLTSCVLSKNYATDSTDAGAHAFGGAVLAGGNVTIVGSTINANSASTSQNSAGGGGIYALGTLTVTNSTISGNTAIDVNVGGTDESAGGGLFAAGDLTLTASTVAYNHSAAGGGIGGGVAGTTFVLINSTVIKNDGVAGGGIATDASLHLNNSTVALNYAGSSLGGGGIVIAANSIFQSSIVANNYAPMSSTTADMSSEGHAFTITGANNLVMKADATITLPGGTSHADPMLASFPENNGGPTQTLALKSGSPAIGAGNNALRLASDQRGPGFARMTKEKTDIGAYQFGDGIFANGFE